VQVLYAKHIATAKHGAAIVQLEDIFHGYRKKPGSLLQNLNETPPAFFGNKRFQMPEQCEVRHSPKIRKTYIYRALSIL
jgi:hypothetical protein